MTGLEFNVVAWLGAEIHEPLEKETLAQLQVIADGIPLTEVEDTLASTVRTHINVPAYLVARWLLVNWWRLRWEPARTKPSFEWSGSHSMAAIGGGYAWPPLTFSSDGERIQLRLEGETVPDASAVRYLRNTVIEGITVASFERAIEAFLDVVQTRLSGRRVDGRELRELRDELRQEQCTPELATACKLQALAGIDPGAASQDWMRAANNLAQRLGVAASEEILAVLPMLDGGLEAAESTITAMRKSAATVRLDWTASQHSDVRPNELPWERGARVAGELRAQLAIGSGPLAMNRLGELLDAKLPLAKSAWAGRHLRGAYRNGAQHGRAAVLVSSHRPDNQRFYLARLIGAALASAADQHVLTVSDVATAFQKFQRSFAQELLCPWRDLDAFTDESGADEEGISEAAEYFGVSEWLVLSTLVNQGKLARSRLPA